MELLTRALETMAWCALYADPQNIQHSLRSSALQPIGDLASWYHDSTATYGPRASALDGTHQALLSAATVVQRRRIVDDVALRRRHLLEASGWTPEVTLQDLSRGRFMLCDDPSNGLVKGACTVASGGFFDDLDLAPWDAWVHYAPALDDLLGEPGKVVEKAHDIDGGEMQLLVWVPETLVDVTSAGMRVSSTELFYWAVEASADAPFTAALRAGGLLT